MLRYLFIDDAMGVGSDGERYQKLLQKDGELSVDLVWPDREKLLVNEADLEGGIDGFILDINLKDQVSNEGVRFIGTGAGLAQDLRLLQALWPKEGQKPRPVVRLCAAQVFQDYLAGDNSTADIFDLGFDKETVGDIAPIARAKLAALPELYAAVQAADAPRDILGLGADQYARMHSRFRVAYEAELARKPHEAVSFLLRQLLDVPGLLVNEELLAVRLGIDVSKSPDWPGVMEFFHPCQYLGAARSGFCRWWMDQVLAQWAAVHSQPPFKLSAVDRVAALSAVGHPRLHAIEPTKESPGDRPWLLSVSTDDPDLRVPVDSRYAFTLSSPVPPWLDEPVWCLEQAKRNRTSPLLSQDSRDRIRLPKPPPEGKA
ncbi:hypothetical protein LB577_21660 [Mesorhizobium sp. B283B1A]|uniref:hypothetical protein n=1 Tax=Mesorhizobium TaxID=68287 RepID=UPI001CD17CBA|nr:MULTISPECIES: hypothetical protein [Mesorhizobium]MCA0049517.1 hypothetical protein [Mesorhizobium sp. B283B1A]UQS63758.1 hypothetical protein M5D98_27165 [Mesorhizobium opportunistum]